MTKQRFKRMQLAYVRNWPLDQWVEIIGPAQVDTPLPHYIVRTHHNAYYQISQLELSHNKIELKKH
jgi:hypothetical protein